jgi:hypothetical protein
MVMPGSSRTLLLLCCILATAVPSFAQKPQMLGPNQCVNCHDHDPEKLWWEKQDGPPPSGHINALNQMETPKSQQFAKAIGLADAYDVKGTCVRCHATVWKGDANAGVSCESCHGPGSAYLEPHKEKGSYAKSVTLGMSDVVGKPQTWVQVCMGCHVMDDKKLVAAGHPSGENFDIAKAFPIVSKHFKKAPEASTVITLGTAARTVLIAQRDGVAPPKDALVLAPNPEPPPIDAPIPAMPMPPLLPPPPAAAPAPATASTRPPSSVPPPSVPKTTTTSAPGQIAATTTTTITAVETSAPPLTSSSTPSTSIPVASTTSSVPLAVSIRASWIAIAGIIVIAIAAAAFVLGRRKS